MIWNFVVIGAVVLIFAILIRKLPVAKEVQANDSIEETTNEEMTVIGLLSQADEAFDKRNFSEAERLYIRAAAQDPDNAKIYNRLGAIYLEQENYYDAKDAFLQTVKIESDNPSRFMNLGLAYLGLKDYFKAAQSFKQALKFDPKNKKYRSLLEKAEKERGREKKKVS